VHSSKPGEPFEAAAFQVGGRYILTLHRDLGAVAENALSFEQ
jgi:hypothetical protein